MPEKRYTRREVEEILARAANQEEDGLAHDDLLAAAREAGLDVASVEEAAQAIVRSRELEEARERRRNRRRRKFFDHLRAFLVVNAALFAFDFLPDQSIGWAFWPLLGWGIGLAFDAMNRLGPEDPDRAERLDQRELRRLQKLRGKSRGLDFRLGPNVQVRVDLPDEREPLSADPGDTARRRRAGR